ncbi:MULTISPECIES: flagellar protein FlgN [Brevibacillus]|uniref:flagellar protein FlgN n=1 Tax=Brevibacillus TaxID=55080 RepID=UPI00156B0B58|nr:flagellar protein FlgN [Brevibacillus sp. RS1.1]NRR03463.1 flagellar protein FlgN [Brevibacillus sp. RS1.1]
MRQLFELLENLLQFHKALYTLAMQKKSVLIKGHVDDLIAITSKEQKLIKGVIEAEEERQKLIKQIVSEKSIALQDYTLAEFIKWTTSAEEKNQLTNYRNDLIRIVSDLRDANELNQQLLGQSLSFVNIQLDMILDTPEEDFIYKKPTISNLQVSKRAIINNKA